MKIVFFAHPEFLGHQSMPRFTNMIAAGMRDRGHDVDIWSPKKIFSSLPAPGSFLKWLGYIDQYIIFPIAVHLKHKQIDKCTLYVFSDQALGPWVPLVTSFPHVVHCHDFLAQLSAEDKIPGQITGWTGKKYQKYIRNGYSKAKNFISVSKKTQSDLHLFLKQKPVLSKVVYNGLNGDFRPLDTIMARETLSGSFKTNLKSGYILHVGGNQWYKNRIGILEIYNLWRTLYKGSLPLLLIGQAPDDELHDVYLNSAFKEDIHFLTGVTDEEVKLGYAGATVFIFPSLAEGFGWPIAEAMASGCPVITTDDAPMNEVAADAGIYIEKKQNNWDTTTWSNKGAEAIEYVVNLNADARDQMINKGLKNAQRFDQNAALDKIEEIYIQILKNR